MFYYIFAKTDKGNFRELNEDSILVNREVVCSGTEEACVAAPFITAVCDGVGGENSGELASQLCLGHLAMFDYSSNADLKKELMNIHNKIKKQGVRREGAANMQTTLCALAVDEKGRACCINVGDSRMYRYVNGTIRQISTDQSYARYLYDHGKIEDMSDVDPMEANAIISSVGSTLNDPQIDIMPIVSGFGKEPDDMILIASDGFTDYVTPEEIEIGMELDIPISKKLSALFHLAVRNGSTDNISVIGIKPYMDDEELKILTQRKTVAGIVKLGNSEAPAPKEALPEEQKVSEITAEIAEEIEEKASSLPPESIEPEKTEPRKAEDVTREFKPIKHITPELMALKEADSAPKPAPLPAAQTQPIPTPRPAPAPVYKPVPAPAVKPAQNTEFSPEMFAPKKKRRQRTDTASELKAMMRSSLNDLKKI